MGDTYEAVVQRALDGIEEQGIQVEHDSADILVDGTPYIDLTDEQKANSASVCVERQLALEWICSEDEQWDNARCDT